MEGEQSYPQIAALGLHFLTSEIRATWDREELLGDVLFSKVTADPQSTPGTATIEYMAPREGANEARRFTFLIGKSQQKASLKSAGEETAGLQEH